MRVATEGLDCGPLVVSQRVGEIKSSSFRIKDFKTAEICLCLKALKKVSGG